MNDSSKILDSNNALLANTRLVRYSEDIRRSDTSSERKEVLMSSAVLLRLEKPCHHISRRSFFFF